MTSKDVYNSAENFLKTLDAAPTGGGTVLKDQASKDWMETSVLRALAKLDAAAYHCSTVARLVEGAHEKAKTIAGPVEHPPSPKLKPTKMIVSGTFSVQEIAFEIDAFLAASRASIDFGGTVLYAKGEASPEGCTKGNCEGAPGESRTIEQSEASDLSNHDYSVEHRLFPLVRPE